MGSDLKLKLGVAANDVILLCLLQLVGFCGALELAKGL